MMGISIGFGPIRIYSRGRRRPARRVYKHDGCWRRHNTKKSAIECGQRLLKRKLTREAEISVLTDIYTRSRVDYRIADQYTNKTISQLIKLMHRPIFNVPLEKLTTKTEHPEEIEA